jgi:hypothetical protein
MVMITRPAVSLYAAWQSSAHHDLLVAHRAFAWSVPDHANVERTSCGRMVVREVPPVMGAPPRVPGARRLTLASNRERLTGAGNVDRLRRPGLLRAGPALWLL